MRRRGGGEVELSGNRGVVENVEKWGRDGVKGVSDGEGEDSRIEDCGLLLPV